MLRRPPQLPDLVAVQGIAAVMAGAVGAMPDQRQRLSKQLEDRLGHLLVGSLVAGAKVVYLSRLALLENERNALAVVLHIDPIALLKPIAVERQGLILQGVRHEEWDELLRILVGAKGVAPAGDHDGQLIGGVGTQGKQIAGRLAGGVRDARSPGGRLRR